MTKAGARLFLHAGFATAALLLFAAASSRAETLDQLYEKAKLEKTLVFYSGVRLHRTRTGPRSSCRNTPASQCR